MTRRVHKKASGSCLCGGQYTKSAIYISKTMVIVIIHLKLRFLTMGYPQIKINMVYIYYLRWIQGLYNLFCKSFILSLRAFCQINQKKLSDRHLFSDSLHTIGGVRKNQKGIRQYMHNNSFSYLPISS